MSDPSISGYQESYRGQVLARECDGMGHMNIQFYIARLNGAMHNTFPRTGVDLADYLDRRVGFAAVQQDNRFISELYAGDLIHMESAILGASNKAVHFSHRLYNSTDGRLCFTSRMTSVYLDLVSRTAIPLTEAMRRQIEAIRVDEEEAV